MCHAAIAPGDGQHSGIGRPNESRGVRTAVWRALITGLRPCVVEEARQTPRVPRWLILHAELVPHVPNPLPAARDHQSTDREKRANNTRPAHWAATAAVY